jgi:hypothetical protein
VPPGRHRPQRRLIPPTDPAITVTGSRWRANASAGLAGVLAATVIAGAPLAGVGLLAWRLVGLCRGSSAVTGGVLEVGSVCWLGLVGLAGVLAAGPGGSRCRDRPALESGRSVSATRGFGPAGVRSPPPSRRSAGRPAVGRPGRQVEPERGRERGDRMVHRSRAAGGGESAAEDQATGDRWARVRRLRRPSGPRRRRLRTARRSRCGR